MSAASSIPRNLSHEGEPTPGTAHLGAVSGQQGKRSQPPDVGSVRRDYIHALEQIESCARCAGLCPSFFLCIADFAQERIHG